MVPDVGSDGGGEGLLSRRGEGVNVVVGNWGAEGQYLGVSFWGIPGEAGASRGKLSHS